MMMNLKEHIIGDRFKTRDGRTVVLTGLECEGIWLGQIEGGNTYYYLEDGSAFDPFAHNGRPMPEDIVGIMSCVKEQIQ